MCEDNVSNDKKVRKLSKQLNDATDILVIDTSGGTNCTITKRAFHITDIVEGKKIALSGYQEQSELKVCSIVNEQTKAFIKGKNDPVIFHINNATLIEDKEEYESLCVPFNLMRYGIMCYMTPNIYEGKGGIKVGEIFLSFQFDEEKLFFKIMKPTIEDLDSYEHIELTSLINNYSARRNRKKLLPSDIPMV